jgi:peptidoglycan hydrolase CwlO-like protein
MKTKLVLWGNDKDDNKVLVTLELLTAENKVALNVIPQEAATDGLYNELMDKWRENQPVVFPEATIKHLQELSLADTLLPEDIKVEKTDIVQRAQTEWHFVVLSDKLYETYLSELQTASDKVDALTGFDKKMWEELKNFQEKVQSQFKDKNLQKNHVTELRERINAQFDKLKQLRSAQDEEFRSEAVGNFDKITSLLGDVENRIESGASFNAVFEDLKSLQKELKTAKLAKDQRNELWERVDAAFKAAKEGRFGKVEGGVLTAFQRIENRYKGLIEALDRMNKSIEKDKKELSFQMDKIKHSRFDGVLEQQISQAKVNMIENRITSKEDKIAEINKTREELERKMQNIKEKEERRKHNPSEPIVEEDTADDVTLNDTTTND